MKKIIVLGMCIVLASCFDIRASIELRADGSARVRYDLALDKAMSGLISQSQSKDESVKTINPIEDLKNKNLPGVRVISETQETDAEGKVHYIAVFELDDIEKLNDEGSKITFTRDGGEIALLYVLSGGEGAASMDSSAKEMEQFIKAMFSNYVIEYEITMPGSIVRSNAHESYGTTARWHYKLLDVMEKPVQFEIRSRVR